MKISIITVVYNSVDKIEDTILSIINQSYRNIEYIIIDGGSTDGTVDIIKKYEDKISYWVSEPDKGIYDAMNKGIDIATGEWVNFMNSGDKFLNNNVLFDIYHSKYFEQSIYHIIYGDSTTMFSNYKMHIIRAKSNVSMQWKGPIFRHGAMFTRTNLLKKYPFKLGVDYKICADFDFIYHMHYLGYRFAHVKINILYFEKNGISNNRISCSKDNKKIVLYYTPKFTYIIWHNLMIMRAYVISFFILPLWKILRLNYDINS